MEIVNGYSIAPYVDLQRADLRGADLRGANLRGANLRGANLQRANLWEADLWGANLWEADLWEADLQGADLQEANLRWADLRGADLRWADLRYCIGNGGEIKSIQHVYHVVWTQEILCCGCHQHPIKDWQENIIRLTENEEKVWEEYGSLLLAIIEKDLENT